MNEPDTYTIMTNYINKDELLNEIERRISGEVAFDENGDFASYYDHNHYTTLNSIKEFIDTMDVLSLNLYKR